MDDDLAPLKDRAWREIADIDERLDRGEIDEAAWHRAMADLIVPAYLAAETPWGGSGKIGTAGDWEYTRSLIADAIDRNGAFLDVGCANGFLLESLPAWTPHRLELYGLDISAALVSVARSRIPGLADHLFVGNALDWSPRRHFDFARTGLEYVPARRRRELVDHLLDVADRVIVGVFTEELASRPTEGLLRSWGHEIAGRSERPHRDARLAYRCVWVDRPRRQPGVHR